MLFFCSNTLLFLVYISSRVSAASQSSFPSFLCIPYKSPYGFITFILHESSLGTGMICFPVWPHLPQCLSVKWFFSPTYLHDQYYLTFSCFLLHERCRGKKNEHLYPRTKNLGKGVGRIFWPLMFLLLVDQTKRNIWWLYNYRHLTKSKTL